MSQNQADLMLGIGPRNPQDVLQEQRLLSARSGSLQLVWKV